MKTFVLFILSFAAAASSTTDDELRTEIAFDNVWSRYLLAKVGCPIPDQVIKVFSADDCVLTPQVLADKKLEARRLAMKVFDLQEKK